MSRRIRVRGAVPRTVVTTEREDVPLDVATHDVPLSLVNDEWRTTVVASVLVSFRYKPCRRVACALHHGSVPNELERRLGEQTHDMEDFPLPYEYVQAVHDVFDSSRPVPPMDV